MAIDIGFKTEKPSVFLLFSSSIAQKSPQIPGVDRHSRRRYARLYRVWVFRRCFFCRDARFYDISAAVRVRCPRYIERCAGDQEGG